MSRTAPFTKASLRRALKVAREEGVRLVVQADGSLTFVKDEGRPQERGDTLETEREIVL